MGLGEQVEKGGLIGPTVQKMPLQIGKQRQGIMGSGWVETTSSRPEVGTCSAPCTRTPWQKQVSARALAAGKLSDSTTWSNEALKLARRSATGWKRRQKADSAYLSEASSWRIS